ncbi:hypothetical protein POM88_048685 [Heracleum sosnowskyi]|uniref:Uncharacterized protein n=1 Tax=Heracleum sosnowskyi TaxID=360622 RepID=A0AAD8M0Q3_9APIA|nr:hypothetical protein POM88_048685 [Heracleum sosnowskyi]
MLIDPKLAEHYRSSNQIFPIREATTPSLHLKLNFFSCSIMYYKDLPRSKLKHGEPIIQRCTASKDDFPTQVILEDPKGSQGLVNAPTMFMVTDDLVVSPLSSTACFNYLNRLKVPPSEVEELVVDVSIQEALNLLCAALNSTSVLTNGLKDSVEMKQLRYQNGKM